MTSGDWEEEFRREFIQSSDMNGMDYIGLDKSEIPRLLSFITKTIQSEREKSYTEGRQSACPHGLFLKMKDGDGERCMRCGKVIINEKS